MSLRLAAIKAIDTCIQTDVLRDILVKNRAGVLNMLLTEYDEKKHMRTLYWDGYEEGEKAGLSRGEQKLLEKQVRKKLLRGKDAATIADELETETETICGIIRRLEDPSE